MKSLTIRTDRINIFPTTGRVEIFPRTYDINPINSTHIESVCVLEKKQFNVKPTKKAQRQAQFRSSKMSKKKR